MQRCWRVAQHDGRGAAEEDASLLDCLAEEVLDCLLVATLPDRIARLEDPAGRERADVG
jgi:hypothetical protein